MKTDFKEYLQKKKAQSAIDKIVKKYADKKVVLYGAGYMAQDLLRAYDFSKLNIIGVADIKFQNDQEGDFFGYKKIGSYDLPENDFDLLIITAYDDELIREFLEEDLFDGGKMKFKIETLIKTNILDYIKKLLEE